jgi:RNA 2',3'-cyclic 3'-phosphodiesterase
MDATSKKTFRVFTAFDLPPDMNQSLFDRAQDIARGEDGLKCTAQKNIHVTLHFFAALWADDVERLIGAATACAKVQSCFFVKVAGIGVFPNMQSPRILWAGIEQGKDEIIKIKQALDQKLLPLGLPIDKRSFVPHLTIGRVKACKDVSRFQERITANAHFSLPEVEMRELNVIQSTLTPKGPVYETLARCPLG